MLHKSSCFVQLKNKNEGEKLGFIFLNHAALRFFTSQNEHSELCNGAMGVLVPTIQLKLLIYTGSLYDFKFFPSQAFMFMFSAYVFLLIYTFLLFSSEVLSCILYIIKNNEETYGEAVLWMNTRLIFKQKILFHQSSW